MSTKKNSVLTNVQPPSTQAKASQAATSLLVPTTRRPAVPGWSARGRELMSLPVTLASEGGLASGRVDLDLLHKIGLGLLHKIGLDLLHKIDLDLLQML